MNSKGLLLASGGIDSITAMYELKNHIENVMFVNYGQRGFNSEYHWVMEHSRRLGKPLIVEDFRSFYSTLDSPIITGKIDNDSGYEIPSRNLIFISMAVAKAQMLKLTHVFTGLYTGFHPDSTKEFITFLNRAAKLSSNKKVSLYNRFQELNKEDIIKIGTNRHKLDLGKETFTCFISNTKKHCGECSACVARKEAFKIAGIKDTTEYEHGELI